MVVEITKKEFKAKPYKVGNSVVITVPSHLIKSGLINPDKELTFTVEVDSQ